MGRLTERDKYGLWVSTQHMTGQDTWIETYEEMLPAINKLAHYEDMEEQGRLIELPCAVGDTVWKITTQRDAYDDREYIIAIKVSFRIDMLNLIGKTVFLTKEEAEAKLKELEGENEKY